MKMKFPRAIVLSVVALVAAAGIAFGATALKLSTGTSFIPGPRLVDGADLNVLLNAVNTLNGVGSCTATGVTPQTCNGRYGVVTTGTLSTAAATAAAPYVINNSLVKVGSVIECTSNGYSGTFVTNGYPDMLSCVAGAGTITVNIVNTHATNALNGTVAIGFSVDN